MKKFIAIILTLTTLFSVMSLTATAKTVTNSEIVDYARTFEGVPYVWGGHSPSGFDCSGFVNYVFTKKGVPLNDGSEWYKTVSNYGVEVTAEEALPGDIVVWPGHVGIYLGDGMCISALGGDTRKVTVHSVASFTGGSVVLYGRPNGVDYGTGGASEGFYYASISEYDATLTYENGTFTATMVDPDLKESYSINQPDCAVDHCEHEWRIRFTDGTNYFSVGTFYWKKDGAEKNATLYEMESILMVLKEGQWDGESTWLGEGRAGTVLTVEGTKLTWRFDMPDQYNFNAEKMQILDVRVYHKKASPNESFIDKIINVFETIWNYIKKPFELLLGLFA